MRKNKHQRIYNLFNIPDELMPDASIMCINVMTSSWSRVRHWSAPERLQWAEAEKAEVPVFAESSATTKTSGGGKSISNTLGCKSVHDLNMQDILKIKMAKEHSKSHEDDIFNNFMPDDDENPFSLDPFSSTSQVQVFKDQLSEKMTSEQMEESWYKLWLPTSSKSVSDKPEKFIQQPGNESEIFFDQSGNITESIYFNETERPAENFACGNNLKLTCHSVAAVSISHHRQSDRDAKTPNVPEQPEANTENKFVQKQDDDSLPSFESNRLRLSDL